LTAIAGAQGAGKLPPHVPARRFVAEVDFMAGYLLSPDGNRLLWAQTVGNDAGLVVREIDAGAAAAFPTGVLARPAGPIYTWLPDSRHVAYLTDASGDENSRLYVFDSQAAFTPWAVTPWQGVRSTWVAGGEPGTARFFFASNRRDPATMDLYEADALARTVREVARSDGRVLTWIIGTNHKLAGRAHQLGEEDGSDVASEVLEASGSWRTVRIAGGFDAFWVHRLDRAAGKAWALSNVGRDKQALVEIDLASGREKVLAEHPLVDISSAMFPPLRGGPLGYTADAGLPTAHYFDASFAAEIEAALRLARAKGLIDGEPVVARPQSASDDQRRVILRAAGDFDTAELLLDRGSGEVRRLNAFDRESAALLSPERPFSFQASDGRTLHGYVIRPRGIDGPAPLVVQIHGGPWARDYWRPAAFNTDQLLANRGYAVITVNYRGSWGYGREFMMASNQEYSGRLQQDIAEAAQWAINVGIADRSRMAVLGGSFGGFSVLAQLIQKRHDWRCGIDVVGVANWPRVIDNWPAFWRNRHLFEMTFGDVGKPEERARMLANSPLAHVDEIEAPLLVIHGANDVRVLRQDSDEVVARLRKLGRPVQFLTFPDEGHSVRRWRNRLEMWRRIEDTLASCLGGRNAGAADYAFMPH
jgi:dipeptidyl aminopeptidase/acylaminoacyl peptidase